MTARCRSGEVAFPWSSAIELVGSVLDRADFGESWLRPHRPDRPCVGFLVRRYSDPGSGVARTELTRVRNRAMVPAFTTLELS